MNFEAMTWAVKQDLPAREKLVLLMLANRTNPDTGQCNPSMDRLAIDCGMSKASVKRAIRTLEARSLLRVRHNRSGAVNLPNHYELAMHMAPTKISPRVASLPGQGG